MTLGEVARRVFVAGEWIGSRSQYEHLMRRLCIGRADAQVAILEHAVGVFRNMADESSAGGDDGNMRPGDITVAEIKTFFRTLKATSASARPVRDHDAERAADDLASGKNRKRSADSGAVSGAGQKGGDIESKESPSRQRGGKNVLSTTRRVKCSACASLLQ